MLRTSVLVASEAPPQKPASPRFPQRPYPLRQSMDGRITLYKVGITPPLPSATERGLLDSLAVTRRREAVFFSDSCKLFDAPRGRRSPAHTAADRRDEPPAREPVLPPDPNFARLAAAAKSAAVERSLYQQGSALGLELTERGAISLGLRLSANSRSVDHNQFAISQLGSQPRRGAQRAQNLLAGEGVVIAARLWTMRPCLPCLQSGDRTDPTRARPVPFRFHSFLPEPDTSLRFLRRVRSLAQRRAIMLYRLPKQALR